MFDQEIPMTRDEGQNERVHQDQLIRADISRQLRSDQIMRVALMRNVIRQENSTRALVRRFCGFSTFDTDDERKASCEQADGIVTSVTKAYAAYLKEHGDDDASRALAMLDVSRSSGEPLAQFIIASIESCRPFGTMRKALEKDMVKKAKCLPVYEWVESVKGFGAMGLAVIVGECGDLSNYSSVPKVWKRLGLGLIDDRRQGDPGPGATAEDWTRHGYVKHRRSAMWTLGDSMLKCGDTYRQVYLDRKEFEVRKAQDAGLTVVPAAKIPAKRKAEFMSQGHVHRRAQRYMEKRLIRDLWRVWSGQ